MNKKGFVLIETLVVTLFVLFIFTILYNSAVPLLAKYNELGYYDDLDTTYDLYHLRNLILKDSNYNSIKTKKYQKLQCSNLISNQTCSNLFSILELDTNDEIVFLNMSYLNDLKNDSNISYDVKNYLSYIDTTGNILILQKNGYVSYINLNLENLSKNFVKTIKNKVGTGGLIKIASNGTLLNGSGDVREYRYSGVDVNNYVFFDTNGDSLKTDDEIWRIIGVFKDQNGEEKIKLMRNKLLSANETPNTYSIDETEFSIEYSETSSWVYLNKPSETRTRFYSNWQESGIKYFLNTLKDDNNVNGYLSTFTSKAYNLLSNTNYNLGNLTADTTSNHALIKPALDVYNEERATTFCNPEIISYTNQNNCNIWDTNPGNWSGLVGLLTPSDYAYSVDSSNWTTNLSTYNNSTIASNNWMQQTANHTTWEWFMSPSSYEPSNVMGWYSTGSVNSYNVYYNALAIRPVIYLKSTAKILDKSGTIDDPYVIYLA